MRRMRQVRLNRYTHGPQHVYGPLGPVRHVAMQDGELCLWIEQTDYENNPRVYEIVTTENEIRDDNLTWVGTALDDSGSEWHVFERIAS